MGYTTQHSLTGEIYMRDLLDEFAQDVAPEHVFCITPELKRIISP
jgi:hypothetical protein